MNDEQKRNLAKEFVEWCKEVEGYYSGCSPIKVIEFLDEKGLLKELNNDK